MTFLAPIMLFGAAAAAIPIAIHLFFRTRYRTVPWAAMKFLLTSIEQTSRRLKFQELLLLLARVAVLLLLALALARPLWSALNVSSKEEVLAVLVIDNSMSMGVRETDKTRLDIAKESALRVLDQLPPYAHVQIITCSNRAEVIGPKKDSGNIEEARDLIKEIELVHLATDLRPGIEAATAILKEEHSRSRELYVFSDMQKLGWQDQDGSLSKTLRELHEKAQVSLVRCGSKKPRNAAIVAIVPQAEIARPKNRASFAVMLKNTGDEPVRNLTVTLKNDQRAKEVDSQPIDHIAPGETRTLSLSSRFDKVGLSVLTATVKNDDLEADNTFQQVIAVRDQVRVLIVDGAPNEETPSSSGSFELGHALAPIADKSEIGRFPIRLYIVPPRLATTALLAAYDVCVLVNCPLQDDQKRKAPGLSGEFLTGLAEFVRQGNGLIIFGGEHVNAESYNRVLGNQHGLLPAQLLGLKVYPDDKALKFDRKTFTGPAFLPFSQGDLYKNFDKVKIWQTIGVREPAKAEEPKQEPEKAVGKEAKKEVKKPRDDLGRVLLRYSNGTPAILGRKVGSGEVLFVATSADPGTDKNTNDPTWNDWSNYFVWVVFAPSCVTHILERQTRKHNYTAGEIIRWQPDDNDSEAAFVLIPPKLSSGKSAGRSRLGRPTLVDGVPHLESPVLERAGIYYLTRADRENDEDTLTTPSTAKGRTKLTRVPFAVVPDPSEAANLETMSDAELDQQLGFRARHISVGDSTGSVRVDAGSQEWTLWLLALVLLVTVGESVLAWLCGRAW